MFRVFLGDDVDIDAAIGAPLRSRCLGVDISERRSLDTVGLDAVIDQELLHALGPLEPELLVEGLAAAGVGAAREKYALVAERARPHALREGE